MFYSKDLVKKVWEKAVPVKGYNPGEIRKDPGGAWIMRDKYGDTNSEYGWQIDVIMPKGSAEDFEISNLQPVQWENHSCKLAGDPHFPVTSMNASNVWVR